MAISMVLLIFKHLILTVLFCFYLLSPKNVKIIYLVYKIAFIDM